MKRFKIYDNANGEWIQVGKNKSFAVTVDDPLRLSLADTTNPDEENKVFILEDNCGDLVICQDTGIMSKDGKRIYEYDLLSRVDPSTIAGEVEKKDLYTVVFAYGQYDVVNLENKDIWVSLRNSIRGTDKDGTGISGLYKIGGVNETNRINRVLGSIRKGS